LAEPDFYRIACRCELDVIIQQVFSLCLRFFYELFLWRKLQIGVQRRRRRADLLRSIGDETTQRDHSLFYLVGHTAKRTGQRTRLVLAGHVESLFPDSVEGLGATEGLTRGHT